MSARAPLKLGTRGSDLARTQSTTVADALRAAGHDVELTIIKTAGDRDQTSQFGSIGAQGVFVREIEQALVERRIELAVHSFKDLPTTSPDALDHLQDRFTERYYGPLFGALQQRFRHTAQEGVKRLLKKELKGLGDAERTAIEVWSEVLARRFAHIPCLGLRGLLHDGPDGSIDAFLNGLEPEFADELRAAMSAAAQPRDS